MRQSLHADFGMRLVLLCHAILLLSDLTWHYPLFAFYKAARFSFQEALCGFQGAMVYFCRLIPGRICGYECSLNLQ
jgi:hypothetical protein